MTDEPNKKILQSYVFWEWDADTRERGDIVHQAGGLSDHEEICRSVIKTGEMPQEAGQ